MRRRSTTLPLTALLLPLLAASAGAHGANYPTGGPPPGPRPPGFTGPGDTVAPRPGLATPGASTPGAPAATRPGSLGLGGAAARPAGATSGPLAAPAATTGGTIAELVDLSAWSFWWEFNKEPYLALRARQAAALSGTGSDGYFLGAGWRDAAGDDRRLPDAVLRDELVPTVLDALAASKSNDVTTACLVALARIGEDHASADRAGLHRIIAPYLEHSSQEVAETAAAALGILGDESAALLLADLALDTEAGRRAVGRTRSVSTRTRAFAAYGLGLIGAQTDMEDVRRYAVHKLVRALETDDTAGPDLGVACVSAIGRVPLAWSRTPDAEPNAEPATASREAQARALLAVLADRKAHRTVRAHVPTSLAVLLHDTPDATREAALRMRTEVVEALAGVLRARRPEPVEMQRGCAIALGTLVRCGDAGEDRRGREALLDEDASRAVRRFALLSLGRIAGRARAAEREVAAELEVHLLGVLGRSGNDLAHWAALGLALFDREQRARGGSASGAAREALLERLQDARAPLDFGAFAIASGLLEAAPSVEALLERLEADGDDEARGHAAIALGLIGHREAVDALRRVVHESTYRPVLLRQASIALGLLADPGVVRLLTQKLRESRSLAAQAGLAQAIGRVGDASAVGPLVAMVRDEALPERARAFAIVALGLLGDRDPLPWNTLLSAHANYPAAPPTLYDASGFGILNIL